MAGRVPGRATIRDIATAAGVDDWKVRRHLHTQGFPLRTRGHRTVVDPVAALRLHEAGISLRQMARQLGASQTAITNALRRAGVEPSAERRMSRTQAAALTTLIATVPPGRGARFDLTITQGARLLTTITRLVAEGIHIDAIGVTTGVSGSTIRRWTAGT